MVSTLLPTYNGPHSEQHSFPTKILCMYLYWQ